MPRTIDSGSYAARAIDKTPTATEGGGLAVWFQIELIDFPQLKFQTWQTLVSKDGTLQIRNIENLKTIFSWDGMDPMFFDSEDISKALFDVVIEDEPDRKDATKIHSRIKWMNPSGSAPGGERPKTIDRGTVASKFASKFRALAGPQKLTAPPAPFKPKVTPPPPPMTPPAPATDGPRSTMEAAWGELCGVEAGKSQDELVAIWQKVIGTMFPGKDNNLTPHEWEAVRKAFEDNIPY